MKITITADDTDSRFAGEYDLNEWLDGGKEGYGDQFNLLAVVILTKAVKQLIMYKQHTTTIKAKQNMYNNGRCFTKGKTYEVNGYIETEASLMERQTINDLGEEHRIGSWWKNFKIVK